MSTVCSKHVESYK